MQTKPILNILLLGLVIASCAFLAAPVRAQPPLAQAGSAMDLIQAVNAYRASVNLAPYEIDGGLMSVAQSHSEYQASILTCTHTRVDGSGPGSHGISAENIACGTNLSVQGAIYSQWSDGLHRATMLGPTAGMVGAGVAYAGSQVYYTLAVKRISGDFTYNPPASPGQSGQSSGGQNDSVVAQPVYQSGIVANTPNADGSISHIVQYGDTLIGIAEAYGVPMADIISMNSLDPRNPVIYERRALLIRVAFTATPFITETYTPRPPTRTPQPTRTPRPTGTATVMHTPLPTRTLTATPVVRIPSLDELGPGRQVMAYAFISVSALGLVVLLITSFLPRRGGGG